MYHSISNADMCHCCSERGELYAINRKQNNLSMKGIGTVSNTAGPYIMSAVQAWNLSKHQ